ncbi:MAG: hypothetical protein AAF958_13065 [Planctomycetota bacterium]
MINPFEPPSLDSAAQDRRPEGCYVFQGRLDDGGIVDRMPLTIPQVIGGAAAVLYGGPIAMSLAWDFLNSPGRAFAAWISLPVAAMAVILVTYSVLARQRRDAREKMLRYFPMFADAVSGRLDSRGIVFDGSVAHPQVRVHWLLIDTEPLQRVRIRRGQLMMRVKMEDGVLLMLPLRWFSAADQKSLGGQLKKWRRRARKMRKSKRRRLVMLSNCPAERTHPVSIWTGDGFTNTNLSPQPHVDVRLVFQSHDEHDTRREKWRTVVLGMIALGVFVFGAWVSTDAPLAGAVCIVIAAATGIYVSHGWEKLPTFPAYSSEITLRFSASGLELFAERQRSHLPWNHQVQPGLGLPTTRLEDGMIRFDRPPAEPAYVLPGDTTPAGWQQILGWATETNPD